MRCDTIDLGKYSFLKQVRQKLVSVCSVLVGPRQIEVSQKGGKGGRVCQEEIKHNLRFNHENSSHLPLYYYSNTLLCVCVLLTVHRWNKISTDKIIHHWIIQQDKTLFNCRIQNRQKTFDQIHVKFLQLFSHMSLCLGS